MADGVTFVAARHNLVDLENKNCRNHDNKIYFVYFIARSGAKGFFRAAHTFNCLSPTMTDFIYFEFARRTLIWMAIKMARMPTFFLP